MANVMELHVLVVSNHWGARKTMPAAGIFVDRQITALKKLGVRINTFDIGLSHSPIRLLRTWFELRRLVQRLDPDLVHGQYGTIVGFLAAFASKPAVISYCGNDLRPGASVSRFRMYLGFLLSNIAALRARVLICKSAQLRQALWWRRNQAVVIPSGVDIDLFSPGSKEDARRQLGWDLSRPIVIFNTRNDPRNKGLDLAMIAMRTVRSKMPEAEMLLIENVDPDLMPAYYRAADVLLCASLSEGSPNVVKEALACNLPVVSTSVGDVQERLAGVQPSAVVTRDANAIGEALLHALFERKRSNGREHVANLCSENIAQRIVGVYQQALGHSMNSVAMGVATQSDKVNVVPITDGSMLIDVVELHMEAFKGYPNTLLGRGYIRELVRWFITHECTVSLAAVDGNHQIVGYVLGAPAGYSDQLNRDLLLVVAIRMLLRPWLFLNLRFWTILTARLKRRFGLQQNTFKAFKQLEPSMSLVAIGVRSSQRRSKIGQRLMQAFEARAQMLQVRSLKLYAYSNRTEARRFYERCGWQACEGSADEGGVTPYFKILQSSIHVGGSQQQP